MTTRLKEKQRPHNCHAHHLQAYPTPMLLNNDPKVASEIRYLNTA
jgi:hypothetical protein